MTATVADEAEKSQVGKLFDKTTRGGGGDADDNDDNNIVTIGATVDTGLEWLAVDECREKFNSDIEVIKERGKIYFNVPVDEFSKVQEMRSIDNIFIVGDVRKFSFKGDEKEDGDLALISRAVSDDMKLDKYLNAWKVVSNFPGKMYPTSDEWKLAAKDAPAIPAAEEASRAAKEDAAPEQGPAKGRKRGRDPSAAEDGALLSYRVTCERVGEHSFPSQRVAGVVGGQLQDKYNWLVDLTKFHLEIVCKVRQDEMIVNLRVTHRSKHRRNIVHFGPTTLRATVCYNLLKLAEPQTGDIIIDPMCGGGSIPIEATLAFPKTYILGGDNHDKAVARTRMNLESLPNKHKVDLLKWDVTKLPFNNSQIDVFVTDMPFGKRSGSMFDNRVLYKNCLVELARVAKLSVGRLVLLTYDRRSISRALRASRKLLVVTKMLAVNMGGLNAAAYVLKRTGLPHQDFTEKSSFVGSAKNEPNQSQ